ncbi:MAG: restriction endonuclease subunit S [Deltaproteobacteria bacterium]|nr:restriction endonuclease subunit S [Deltaproteobacteria bacterium]
MSEWENVALGDFGSFTNGINKDKNAFGKGVPFVNLLDIYGKESISREPAGLVQVTENEIKNYDLKKGDILFARSSVKPEGVGQTCVVLRNFDRIVYSGFIIRYRQFDQKIWYQYAKYCFDNPIVRRSVLAKSTVSANTNINQESLKTITVPLPPLPHQRKIARILNTVDSIIEKTEAAIAKYKAIKQGMMHDLFTRGIDVKTGKLRPKFEDAPELYKESELGCGSTSLTNPIPKEWEVKRLGALAKDGLKNGYFKKPEYVGWGYKLINVSDLYQPYEIDINQKDVQRVFATANDYSKYEVQVGDLFFTRSSLVLEGIAHCNIVLKLPEPSVWECHVVRLRPDKQKISPGYLGFYCTTYEARLFFMSIAKQVTMTTISQPDIAKLPVCAPTNINEQKEIAKRLRSIDRHIQNEEIAKLKYQKLKSGLMQDLLTGKKEVTPDPEDYKEMEN